MDLRIAIFILLISSNSFASFGTFFGLRNKTDACKERANQTSERLISTVADIVEQHPALYSGRFKSEFFQNKELRLKQVSFWYNENTAFLNYLKEHRPRGFLPVLEDEIAWDGKVPMCFVLHPPLETGPLSERRYIEISNFIFSNFALSDQFYEQYENVLRVLDQYNVKKPPEGYRPSIFIDMDAGEILVDPFTHVRDECGIRFEVLFDGSPFAVRSIFEPIEYKGRKYRIRESLVASDTIYGYSFHKRVFRVEDLQTHEQRILKLIKGSRFSVYDEFYAHKTLLNTGRVVEYEEHSYYKNSNTRLHDSLLLLEYISGTDLLSSMLAQDLRNNTEVPLTKRQFKNFLKVLAAMVFFVEKFNNRGVIYGDVKPSNVIIEETKKGEIKDVNYTDFGLTRSKTAPQTGYVTGTPGYFAPFQYESGVHPENIDDDIQVNKPQEPNSYYSEIWATGITLYRLLYGGPKKNKYEKKYFKKRHEAYPILIEFFDAVLGVRPSTVENPLSKNVLMEKYKAWLKKYNDELTKNASPSSLE